MKLSATMERVLWLAARERDLLEGCRGRSEHGGRWSAIYAARRRGLLRGVEITRDGRAAIGAFLHCDRCGLGEGEHAACEQPDCGALVLSK